MIRSIFLIAGELSADRYAAQLVRELRARLPDLRAEAIGGPLLGEAGVPLLRDSSGWGAIGIAEALKRVPPIWWGQRALKRRLERDPPDLLIPLDFGAFNVPTATFARSRGIAVCYLIPPGSWRPDGGRVSPRLAACADAFLTPFQPSERVLCEKGLDAHWLGHPLLDFLPVERDRAERRERWGLPAADPVLALLPGSRGQELRHLAPAFLSAAAQLAGAVPGIKIVVPLAPSLSPAAFESLLARHGWRSEPGGPASRLAGGGGDRPAEAPGWGADSDAAADAAARRYTGPAPLLVARGRAMDVLAVSDAALVCSGTATLEAALVGCPMVIGYRGGSTTLLEYMLRKAVVPEHIGLPNLLLGRRLCPELIQDACTPERLVDEARELLVDDAPRRRQLEGFETLRCRLGEPGVIGRWAEFIVNRWGGTESGLQGSIASASHPGDPPGKGA